MNPDTRIVNSRILWLLTLAMLVTLVAIPAWGAGYGNALKAVKAYDAVFDVSLGNPAEANIVFWAVKNAYEAPEVKALSKPPRIAIVFHGPAVKLLSSDKMLFTGAEWTEVEKFQNSLRQMKKDGVILEICLYAAEVMKVDKNTIIPEIDQVENGFVSVIGYQMQGYAAVRIP